MSDMAILARPGRFGSSRLRVGAIASLLLLLIGFTSVVWTPYPVDALNVGAAMQSPGSAHWFGTDQLGRDVLSLTMKGMLTSFVVAAVAVVLGAILGLPLGLAAAVWPGLADRAIGGVGDFLLTFPALILAILMATAFGPSMLNVMVAVGIFNVPAFIRVTRDGVLAIRGRDYVATAQLAGTGTIEIARRHILPGLTPLLIAQALTQLAVGVLAEAGLAFVGLGVQPPATSLGLLLHDAQSYAATRPVPMSLVGLALLGMVIAVSLAGSGLRERLDARLRRVGAP